MPATPVNQTSVTRKTDLIQRPPQGAQVLYKSDDLAAFAVTTGSIQLNVSIRALQENVDLVKSLATLFQPEKIKGSPNRPRGKSIGASDKLLGSAFAVIGDRLSEEFDEVVAAYRRMLRESLAKADDSELQSALNRARLQEKILAATIMADQAQACELLGLSGTNPSATMKRKEEKKELLRFTVDGRAVYPLLQFEVEGRRIFPAVSKLIALKPETWSNFRLLHWLTCPHLDFDGTPADHLDAEHADGVIAAFKRQIVPAEHG